MHVREQAREKEAEGGAHKGSLAVEQRPRNPCVVVVDRAVRASERALSDVNSAAPVICAPTFKSDMLSFKNPVAQVHQAAVGVKASAAGVSGVVVPDRHVLHVDL